MILNFINGLNYDRSEPAKKFYLALNKNNVPENEVTKREFINQATDDYVKSKAECVNFVSIFRTNNRIVIKFPKPEPVTDLVFDDIKREAIVWFMCKGERVEGPIVKEIISHDKKYVGVMHDGKLKYKLKTEINTL